MPQRLLVALFEHVLTTYHLISRWSLDVLGDLGVSPSIYFFEFVDPFGSGTLGSLVQYIGISNFWIRTQFDELQEVNSRQINRRDLTCKSVGV